MDAVNGAAANVLTAAASYRKSSLVGKVLGLCSIFFNGIMVEAFEDLAVETSFR